MREDPVRMLRAVALAARLDFTIDPPVLDAIRTHRHEIAQSSAPRLLEEYYKILRAGSAEKTFRMLAELGLLEPISGELHRGAAEPLWRSLANLDAYRRRFETMPDTLTNPILLGSLLVPLGISLGSGSGRSKDRPLHGADRSQPGSIAGHGVQTVPRLGALPLARRDVERLRQILGLQRRLRDVAASPRAQRALAHRSLFREALIGSRFTVTRRTWWTAGRRCSPKGPPKARGGRRKARSPGYAAAGGAGAAAVPSGLRSPRALGLGPLCAGSLVRTWSLFVLGPWPLPRPHPGRAGTSL